MASKTTTRARGSANSRSGGARTSRAATILARHRLPESRAALLADATPPAWVLINVPMTALSSSAIRSARRKAAERPGATAPVAGLRP